MVNEITWEELTRARLSDAKKKRDFALTRAELASKEAKRWEEYIITLEKALELDKQQVNVSFNTQGTFIPDNLLKQSTWENLISIMNANKGLLIVVDAVKILVEAKVFNDREHARNVIYSTLYSHKKDMERVRKGVYQMRKNHLEPKGKSIKLNNPISFKPGVAKILQDAQGEALNTSEIWKRMQDIGIKSKSSDPIGWVDFTAKQIHAERVAPHVWRWQSSETPIDLAKRYERELKNSNMSQAELAESLGTTQSVIANTIRLLELPEDVQKMIVKREITETHGRNLLQLKDKQLISRIAEEIVKYQYTIVQLDARLKQILKEQQPSLLPIAVKRGGENESMKEITDLPLN